MTLVPSRLAVPFRMGTALIINIEVSFARPVPPSAKGGLAGGAPVPVGPGRDEVSRPSYLVTYETAVSSARAWSIWSYA